MKNNFSESSSLYKANGGFLL